MKPYRSAILAFVVAVVATFVQTLAPLHVAADQTAKAFLEQRHTEVMRVLRAPAGDAQSQATRDTQLDALLGHLLNYEELSKRALKDHWSGLSAAQQTEFVELLRKLVQRSYRRNMQSSLDFAVSYVDETPSGEDITVHTRARSKKNRRAPEITIDYALAKSGSEWRVFDVITDGVSMVGNYRSQFNRIIRKDGWDALLAKMRARLHDGTDL